MKALKVDEAKDIYFANYWNALSCGALPAGLDLVVFDFGVNAGVRQAAKVLQRCVFVADDGVIGPITLGAIENFGVAELIRKFGQERMKFYKSLGTFATFGPGWRNRVEIDRGGRDQHDPSDDAGSLGPRRASAHPPAWRDSGELRAISAG